MNTHDIIELASPLRFAATVERLVDAIARSGMILFCRIDHAEGARHAGLAMPPATVLIYGHPKGGTPLMLAAPLAALDLPLRVLIRQRDDGTTAIAFRPVVTAMAALGVCSELAARLSSAQEMLVAAIAA